MHIQFNLAVMLEKEGRLDEAAGIAENLLRLYPDFQAARQLAGRIELERSRGGD